MTLVESEKKKILKKNILLALRIILDQLQSYYGLAQVLGLRSIQNRRFRADVAGEASEKPSPELPNVEAGTSWETHVFGGIYHPFSMEPDLALITGLAIQSSWWRYLHMTIKHDWMSVLFGKKSLGWAGRRRRDCSFLTTLSWL